MPMISGQRFQQFARLRWRGSRLRWSCPGRARRWSSAARGRECSSSDPAARWLPALRRSRGAPGACFEEHMSGRFRARGVRSGNRRSRPLVWEMPNDLASSKCSGLLRRARKIAMRSTSKVRDSRSTIERQHLVEIGLRAQFAAKLDQRAPVVVDLCGRRTGRCRS